MERRRKAGSQSRAGANTTAAEWISLAETLTFGNASNEKRII